MPRDYDYSDRDESDFPSKPVSNHWCSSGRCGDEGCSRCNPGGWIEAQERGEAGEVEEVERGHL